MSQTSERKCESSEFWRAQTDPTDHGNPVRYITDDSVVVSNASTASRTHQVTTLSSGWILFSFLFLMEVTTDDRRVEMGQYCVVVRVVSAHEWCTRRKNDAFMGQLGRKAGLDSGV